MSEQEIMVENINRALNSEFLIDILKDTWEQTHNISSLGNIIGEVYNHMIIHKDGYRFEDYIKQISSAYGRLGTHQLNKEQFDIEKSKIISSIIATKIGIDITKPVSLNDMNKIKEFYLKEYIEKGYVSHSFPEAYKDSILSQGLIATPERRGSLSENIQQIQEMFMDKGVVSPIGGYPYYGGSGIYYEHNFTNAFQHAINSPEWFNWFTSSDHSKGFQRIEKSPYILRNEEACRRNIDDLCSNADLSIEQTSKVVQFYKDNYSKFSSPNLNVGLISKKLVGKDDVSKAVPASLGLLETISYTMQDKANQYQEHQGNVYMGIIPPSEIQVTNIPTVNKFIKVNEYERESKEHLTDINSNLALLSRAESNGNRMTPRMNEKIIKTKERLRQEKTKNIQTETIRKSFDQRSQTEIQVANQIREKNQMIKKQKQAQKLQEKGKVKTLTKNSNNSGNKGYVNPLVLSLIVSFIAGALFMVAYMIIGGK